jgi:hypothetical protein
VKHLPTLILALATSGSLAAAPAPLVRSTATSARRSTSAEGWLAHRQREWEARLDRFEDYLSTLKCNGEE